MKTTVYLLASLTWAAVISMNPTAARAASFVTTATSDAFLATGPTGNLSANNYGGGGALAIAAGALPKGEFQSVIRFGLSGLHTALDTQYGAGQWVIQSVSLQLSASPHSNALYNDVAPGSFGVSLMQNSTWVEGTGNASNPANNGISYNSLQSTYINPATDLALGTFNFAGGESGNQTYALDLSPQWTSDIIAGNELSLRLFAADNSLSYIFSSRAASPASSQPTLIITAIPEARTVVLMGLGLAGLIFRRRSGSD